MGRRVTWIEIHATPQRAETRGSRKSHEFRYRGSPDRFFKKPCSRRDEVTALPKLPDDRCGDVLVGEPAHGSAL